MSILPLKRRSISDLIDARASNPVERTAAVVTAEDAMAMAMLEPGDVLIDSTGAGLCFEITGRLGEYCHGRESTLDWNLSSYPHKQPPKCYLIDSLSLALRQRLWFYPVFGT